MKGKFVIFATVLSLALGSYAFAEETQAAVEETMAAMDQMEAAVVAEAADAAAVVEEAAPKMNKVCPISGHEIGSMGEAVEVEYNGKKYNLCCAMCKADFEKDPAKFAKMMDDAMAAEAAAAASEVVDAAAVAGEAAVEAASAAVAEVPAAQ
jgi:YHS domain-containing protein